MEALASPGLAVALALSAGVIAQSLARHARLPGIVVLLASGVLLGPDSLGLILPGALGDGLTTLVGFAVAVILFEGGMNLDLKRLGRERRPIRRLVTVGALITAVGGTLIARLVLGWDWRASILFGTLVIVTGPTVVNPLLRRLKVDASTATILEAEGVLGDAIGAIAAAVALEIAIHPSGSSVALGPLTLLARLGFGAVVGSLAGFALASLLKWPKAIPEGLENIFILSLVLALFQGANALIHETGIPAVTAAGVMVGNRKGIPVQRDLFEFKEQLTVMLIGLLFVLLAADVRLADVHALGWRGVLAVALLLLVLRPLTVLASTWRSDVSIRQRLFISWIGPRGIVAATVASLFATRLAQHDYAGGQQLRALVFLVIATSVMSAGLTGGLVARLLGVRRKLHGWVILGANELAREVALLLSGNGEEVVCIDSNADYCRAAQNAGLRVLSGNGLEESTRLRAGIEHRLGVLAITPNDEINFLFVEHVKEEAKPKHLGAAVSSNDDGATVTMLERSGSNLLFGQAQDVGTWCVRLRHRSAANERWRLTTKPADAGTTFEPAPKTLALFLTVERGEVSLPASTATRFRQGDVARILLHEDRRDEAQAWLIGRGWSKVEDTPPSADQAG